MDIGILGPLMIQRDDTPIVVRALKQRTVLLRLVLDIGKVVSTDRLLDDVWAGQPPPQGLITLRSYISSLRSALGGGDGDEPVLLSDAQGYVLALPPESVDAFRFEQLAQRGQSELTAGDVGQALSTFEAALDLWRGPVLPEVADEHFARPHVVRLEELRLGVEEARFDGLLRTGRHAEALPRLESFVAQHPMREPAWTHLVVAQYRSGRAPDALESHRAFRDLLADELGLDPSPAFRRLAELILQQSPELDIADPAPVTVRQPVVTTHTRLVGRDAERERLVEALGSAFDGRGRLVLVSGPPGIGKTALLQDFAATAAPHGVRVHWGRCLGVGGTPAFWPWIQVIRSIADEADDERLGALVGGAATAVTQLVPELAGRVDVQEVVQADDPATARFRQFEGVVAFLCGAAEVMPVVVVLDDLHWADDASLDLLAFLVPQLVDLSVVVATTFRDLAVDQRADLSPFLAGAARVEETDHIELGGLTEAEVADLLANTLESPLIADQVRVLYERSDGNPFFVRQLARLLEGEEADPALTIGELPAGIRHVLRRRLDLLPASAREILEAGAVLGRDFDLRQVAALLGLAPHDLVDPIDTAVEHGIVERAGPAATRQRFVHALVREVLYDRLPPARAARMHAAAAGSLDHDRGATPQEVAEHYWRSAELFSDDRPVLAMLAAARAAIDVLAYEQADELMVRSLDLVERHPEPSPALELHVRLEHLGLANGALRWSDPAAIAELALIQDLAGAAGIGPELGPLWWRARTFAAIRGEHDVALALSRMLVADAERSDDPAGVAAGHVGAAFSLSCLGDLAAVRAELALARPLLNAMSADQLASFDVSLDVVALVSEAIAEAQAGEEAAARAAADGAVGAAERHGRFVRAYARVVGAVIAAMLDDPDDACRRTEATIPLCDEHGFTMLARLAQPVHGWSVAHQSGRPAEQTREMAKAVDWITAVGHHHLTPLLLGLLAEVHLRAGQDEDARRRTEEASAAAAATGERFSDDRLEALTAASTR